MSRLHKAGIQILTKQPINQVSLFVNQMGSVSSLKENGNAPLPQNSFEKEYIDFIDLAAHDLDAPLRKLNILISRLTDKLDTASQDKDIQSYVERIDHSLKDMRALVDDMSMLAKVASGRKEYTFCYIEGIMKQILQDHAGLIQSRKAVVHLSALPIIKGDPAQLMLLFKNLIENSLKFHKENTVTEIHIRSAVLTKEETDHFNLPPGKTYHRMEIADNGIGFKNEYAEKIFRPFIRLHGKSQFPGTGIGLAVCRKIADIHGGIIYAESHESKGASFVLILPETR